MLTVDTGFDVVQCVVDKDSQQVQVAMGKALFRPAQIPCTTEIWNEPYPVSGGEIFLWSVGMGNPHCVSFFEPFLELDSLDWRSWGAALEQDPRFPNRSNVQFARVLSPSVVDIRIWERGAGETAASGSSACAVAAVANKMGWVASTVTVRMPGGELLVALSEDDDVVLTGPVVEIGTIELSENWIVSA